MPVQCFVNRASQRPESSLNDDETPVVIAVIKRIYDALQQHQNFYAVIANLPKQQAMTDLVIITEHGLGVVELKDCSGSISLRGTTWYAGSEPIAGNPDVGYRNPHEQVQLYAGMIRDLLIGSSDKPADWRQFQFGTAVCFTSKEATFARFPFWHYKKSKQNPHIKPWEQFAILKPDELPGWAAALQWKAEKRSPQEMQGYRLSSPQITRIVTEVFGATPWQSIFNQQPKVG